MAQQSRHGGGSMSRVEGLSPEWLAAPASKLQAPNAHHSLVSGAQPEMGYSTNTGSYKAFGRWAGRFGRVRGNGCVHTEVATVAADIRAAPGAEESSGENALRWEPVFGTAEGAVVDQVRRLAQAEFREDALEIVEAGGMWEALALMQADAVVGFVVFGVLDGEMSLRYLAVSPEHRGRGHGRRLVDIVRERCVVRGVRQIGLYGNREAVSFYRSLGFHEVPDEEEGDSEDDLQVPMVCWVALGAEQALAKVDEAAEELELPG